jgi:hypothetical protein
MKKLRANIDRYFDRLDERWRALSVRKQHRYILYFFTAYLLLTIGVILKVWYDTGKPDHSLVIEHIENPVIKKNEYTKPLQDSLSIILKNKMYERK